MKKTIKFVVWLLMGSFISYYLIDHYVVSTARVEGASMDPTFHAGQTVLVNHLPLLWRNPVRGEVVVVFDTEIKAGVIKRIDGVPGDEYTGKKHLNANQFYILGDNSAVSVDSRFYGPISRRNIIGIVQ